jgi:cell division protein FtsL
MKNKIPTIVIAIIIAILMAFIFIPKDYFDSVLYGIARRLVDSKERKIEGKEEQGKSVEKNIKSLEKQDKQAIARADKLKKQRNAVKSAKSLDELDKDFRDLGYPTK